MSNNRIIGYDVARSLALLGMIFISYWGLMKRFMEDCSPPEWVDFFMKTIEGRPAVMFVTLAGVGLYLLSRAACSSHDPVRIAENRETLMRRALFLFFVGMLNSLITPWDILHFYAVYFMIAAYLVTASNRRLWVVISSVVVVFALFMVLIRFQRGDDWVSIKPMNLWHLPGVFYHLFFCGIYSIFPWIGFLCIGIWLGRHDLTNRPFRRKILFVSILVVIAAEAVSRIFFSITNGWHTLKLGRLIPWLDLNPWEPMPLFFFSGAGTAIIGICLCVMLTEKLKNAKWLLPFAIVGQTTLTLYLAHTIVGWAALTVMNLMGIQSPLFPVWGPVLFFAAGLIFCHRWNRRFNRGPLELIIRAFAALPVKLPVPRLGAFFGKVRACWKAGVQRKRCPGVRPAGL